MRRPLQHSFVFLDWPRFFLLWGFQDDCTPMLSTAWQRNMSISVSLHSVLTRRPILLHQHRFCSVCEHATPHRTTACTAAFALMLMIAYYECAKQTRANCFLLDRACSASCDTIRLSGGGWVHQQMNGCTSSTIISPPHPFLVLDCFRSN